MSDKAVEPPSPVAIARALTGFTTAPGAVFNYEFGSLEAAHRYLSEEPPNIKKARAELADGMAHAFRQFRREDERPETWLVAACAQLLSTC